jgi:hypothetical protein
MPWACRAARIYFAGPEASLPVGSGAGGARISVGGRLQRHWMRKFQSPS